MAGQVKHSGFILLMCAILCMVSVAHALYEPVISDSTVMFYAFMDDYGYAYSVWDNSSGGYFCKTFKDRATYAGYGWDSAYTLTVEGYGSEYEGRMTEITYDAALERTFAPGKTDAVLQTAYEAFLAAAGSQFNDSTQFDNRYSRSRMWQAMQTAVSGYFDPAQLSARIEGWDIVVDVMYGENEMHFYFRMSR